MILSQIPSVGSTLFTGTLLADSWDGTTQTQTLTISGLEVDNYVYIVTAASTSFDDYSKAGIYAEDVTTANSIVFHFGTSTPTVDIDIQILKVQI